MLTIKLAKLNWTSPLGSAGGVWLYLAACWAIAAEPAAPPVAATVPAATAPAAVQTPGKALERSVREALLQAAQRKGQPDAPAVERLVSLYQQVMLDTELPAATREALRLAVRSRLLRWSAELRQLPAKSLPAQPAAILAQQAPLAVQGQPAQAQQAATHGPELVNLIEMTVHPTSWDKVGGPGVIRFWAPGNALVVRQTTEVHEDLGRLLNDLR